MERRVAFVPRLYVGGSANNAPANGGSFTFNANNAPSNTNWNNGCGLSYLKRNAFNINALYNPHPLVKIARRRAGIVGGLPHEISVGDKKARFL